MQHVLVTGASGGLGTAVTQMLGARGVTVFALDLDTGARAAGPPAPGVIRLAADVTRADSVDQALAEVRRRTDGLDGVVCCAAVFTGGPLAEAGEQALVRAFDVNVAGAHRLVRASFPLLARRKGCVVLVSSESARFAMPFNGPYTVTKYALEAYADCLRREVQLAGVRVAVIQPGAFRSNLLTSADREAGTPGRDSAFAHQVRLVHRMLERERIRSMPAERVARVVLRALAAPRPRARYRVGNNRPRMLLRFLPARAADSLIKWFMQ
ncbi:MAG TPA: SDR family NAD(P)-dependent oxidoreductase [Spirochaetia bacterium]|nr:SDR family NAD(P)-dependent oxidoreductase [Spirochaetia bacterium]